MVLGTQLETHSWKKEAAPRDPPQGWVTLRDWGHRQPRPVQGQPIVLYMVEQKSSEKTGQRRMQSKEEGRAAGNFCAGTAPSWAAWQPSAGSRAAMGTMGCESKGKREERHWAEAEHGEEGGEVFPSVFV